MTYRSSDAYYVSLLDKHVRVGKVYQREYFLPYSTSVDRELQRLVATDTLLNLAQGLYYKPKMNVFGEVPPEE